MADTDHLRPLVLPVTPRAAERHGPLDLYPPDANEPRPAVVLVHGGPIPTDLRPTPRDWPQYRGYGALLAARGLVAAVVDHRLHDPGDYPRAAADVTAAVAAVRADPRTDPARTAVWFFSGGGLLMADWLRTPPPWLRCVAGTYPLLTPLPGWTVDPRFRPVEAVTAASVPVILTRAGRDHPPIVAGTDAFVAAARNAGARLQIVDVPDGRHGFDILDDTDAARIAIDHAVTAVHATLAGTASPDQSTIDDLP